MSQKNQIYLFIFLSVSTVIYIYLGRTTATPEKKPLEQVEIIPTTPKPAEIPDSIKALLAKEWKKSDFSTFWKEFLLHKDDKFYLKGIVHFPYSNSVYQVDSTTFEKVDFKHQIKFDRDGETSTRIFDPRDYMCQPLIKFTKKQFGNLRGLHVAFNQPDPMGYMAYFKYMNKRFYLIGYEIIDRRTFYNQ